jgi:hypothetical protein
MRNLTQALAARKPKAFAKERRLLDPDDAIWIGGSSTSVPPTSTAKSAASAARALVAARPTRTMTT